MRVANQVTELLGRSDDWADRHRHRRLGFSLCLGLLVPIVAYLGFFDYSQGRVLESALVLSMAALLAVLGIAALKVENARVPYRIAAGAAVPLVAFEVAIGASSGHGFLWLYLYPMLMIVLLGEKEGLLWSLAAAVACAPFLLTPLGTDFAPGVAWRFLITFAVATLFSYSLEASRRRYENRLREERAALREALEQVVTLRGLLPLCPSCKKVRQDGGYWERIEDLFARQVDIRFSHGLCPDCVEQVLAEIEGA